MRAEHPIQLPPVEGKVTVGIPVYNMAHVIEDAINSVLAQTHQDFELLILDDSPEGISEFDLITWGKE